MIGLARLRVCGVGAVLALAGRVRWRPGLRRLDLRRLGLAVPALSVGSRPSEGGDSWK